MIEKIKKFKLLAGIVIIALLAIVPLTVNFLQKQQETRSRASGEAVAVILNPLTGTVPLGNALDVNVAVNAGQNNISAVDISFTYDANILEKNTGVLNVPIFTPSSSFTTIINDENTPGTVHFVGVNPTSNTLTGSVNIGKLNFAAKTSGTATVGFSNIHINASGVPGALPVDTTNTQNGSYTIAQLSASPTAGQAETPTPYVPSPTPFVPSPTSIVPTGITPTSGGFQTSIELALSLPGIGSESSTLRINKNPAHPQRSAELKLFNAQNAIVFSTRGSVNFDRVTGLYKGTLPLGNIAQGPYIVKVRLENTLWRQLAGIQTIVTGTLNQTPAKLLATGDVNGDNVIDLLDYNLMLACRTHRDLCTEQN